MSELMLRTLNDAEVEKLHEKTLDLLAKVGATSSTTKRSPF